MNESMKNGVKAPSTALPRLLATVRGGHNTGANAVNSTATEYNE